MRDAEPMSAHDCSLLRTNAWRTIPDDPTFAKLCSANGYNNNNQGIYSNVGDSGKMRGETALNVIHNAFFRAATGRNDRYISC